MNNEQEWRDRLFKEIDKIQIDVSHIKQEMNTLKVKVASFSAFIGALVHALFNGFNK